MRNVVIFIFGFVCVILFKTIANAFNNQAIFWVLFFSYLSFLFGIGFGAALIVWKVQNDKE